MSGVLQARGLCVGYGRQADVLHGIDLDLAEGEVLGIIGANGAGKSTLLKALAGTVPIRTGEVLLDGSSLNRVSDRGRLMRGVVMLPEGHRVLRNLTVEENLKLAASRFWRTGMRRALAETLPQVYALFPILAERRHGLAGNLSGGEQQQLSLGRSLIARPRVLLLDEPSLGLAPAVIDRIYESLRTLTELGIGTVVVEQDHSRVGDLCHRLQVVRLGQTVANVTPDQVDEQLLADSYF